MLLVAEVDLETSSVEITSKSTLLIRNECERTISSSIPKSADTIHYSSRRLPQYYGLGKMDRGKLLEADVSLVELFYDALNENIRGR